MAALTDEKPAEPASSPASAALPPDTASLDLKALAEAILARKIRPRVADVRRLAEAVLEPQREPITKKKKKKADKKADRKKRKLSKIPGQERSK